MVVGYMANNLLPVRLGEVVRSYYLSRRDGVSASASLATIVVERVFDGLTLLVFIACVTLSLPVLTIVSGLAREANIAPVVLIVGGSLPFLAVGGLLLLFASFPGAPLKVAMRVSRYLPVKINSRIEPLALRFLEGLATLKSPRRIVGLFLLSVPIWLAEAAMYLMLSYSFQINQAFSSFPELVAAILLLTAVSNLATSLPSSPGGVGPFEFFAKGAMVLLGVGSAQATAYVGVLHVALLVPVTVAGLVVLRAGRLSLGGLTRDMQARGGSVQKTP
ncbi:MAG: flippase-like domain-containing protein [Dehalococcoidia bacterium]|nr:flippase-like domain-containing protein [Dehalococcoidia bacterium]